MYPYKSNFRITSPQMASRTVMGEDGGAQRH